MNLQPQDINEEAIISPGKITELAIRYEELDEYEKVAVEISEAAG